MRVLFVDDNELNQITGRAILQRIASEFVVLGSADAALEQVQEIAPDVILMDIAMPGIDGLEATKRIRELNLSTNPYILGISGFIESDLKNQALEAGMNAFLEKPYTVDDLRRALDTIPT